MRRRVVIVALAVAIAAIALAYWKVQMVPAVSRPERIESWSADLYESYLPVWTFAYAGPSLVPRWNPYQLAGSPFLASVTGAPAYPPNLLARVLPVPQALGWACALHLVFAGLCTFACGRALGLTRPGAMLAAVGFMLSVSVLAERIHPPYLFGVTWLPAVFLLAGRAAVAPGAWRGAMFGAAVGALLLAGYPEMVCFTSYALPLLLILWLGRRGVPAWRDARRLLVAGIVAGLVAAGLASIQLLPTLELAGQAVRSFGGLSMEQILAVPPPSWQTVALTAGPLIGLALAAFGNQERLPLALLGLALIAFVCAVGFVTPFYTYVFYRLPGVSLFRLPQAIFPIGVLALALLGGLGLDTLTERSERPAWLGAVAVLAAVPLMLLAPTVHLEATYPLAVLAVAAAVAVVPGTAVRHAGAWLVVALFVVERFAQPASVIMIPQGNAPELFTPTPLVAFLREHVGSQRALVIKNWRTRFPVTEKMGTLYGFPVVQDYEPLTAGAYHEFLRVFENTNVDRPGFGGRFFPGPEHPGWPRLDLLGVRYVAVAPGARWPAERSARFRLVYDAPDGRVYENVQSLPRTFLVSRTVVVSGLEAMLARLDHPDFRPLDEAVVDREIAWPPGAERADVPSRVVIEGIEPDAMALRVSTPTRALLVVSDLHFPGWHASVDADARDVYRVDYLFRGVALAAGEHTVRFWYAPDSVRIGALLSGGTLVVLAVWGLVRRFA